MCERIVMPNGDVGIICGGRHREKKYCACGRAADFLCDWKVAALKSGTCDAPICKQHALQVAPGKHLCRFHQHAYDEWRERHGGVSVDELRDRMKGQQNLFQEKSA